MKKVYGLFLCLFFVINSFGAPVIYKAKKDINSPNGFVEFVTLDVSKYKKIRISIIRNSKKNENSPRVEGISVYGVEDKENFKIYGNILNESDSTVIDFPPNTIKISIVGSGNFSICIWGSL